ncbi:MAG: hypothetical protein IPF46_02775 [Saprospiraceae bacterium]|nr:hypothetical protein [Candidatus Vicinibacter affinis]
MERRTRFELEQSYSIYQFYHALKECDAKIEEHLREKSGVDTFVEPKKKRVIKNNLNFNGKEMLYELTGTDLAEILGLRKQML